MVERREGMCVDRVKKICNELKLMIESDDMPKIRVRAGVEPENVVDETFEQSIAEQSSKPVTSTEFVGLST